MHTKKGISKSQSRANVFSHSQDPNVTLPPQYQTAIQPGTRLRNGLCCNVESGLTRCCFWVLFPN